LNSKTELLCIGNAIVDVFINIDPVLAAKFGITRPVQHIGREQASLILNEVSAAGTVKSSGGGAANAAKIAAMLGINTVFSGCAGRDEFAEILKEDLSAAGVSAILPTSNEMTGVCFICNVEGEMRFTAYPGAALDLTENDIGEELISGADAVILDGYILERRSLVQHILRLASGRGIPVALDTASVFQVKSKAEEILHYSRNFPMFIFMNTDEALAFYNTIRKSCDEEACLSDKEKEKIILRDVCPMLKIITDGEIFPIAVVKMGSRGAVVMAGGNMYLEETFAVMPRNTVGAGDGFLAAFLAAWIRGKSLSSCAALGNKVARKILDVPGSRIEKSSLKPYAKILKNG
jgi:sugar/nucleoside kinase (ribokinase family)